MVQVWEVLQERLTARVSSGHGYPGEEAQGAAGHRCRHARVHDALTGTGVCFPVSSSSDKRGGMLHMSFYH